MRIGETVVRVWPMAALAVLVGVLGIRGGPRVSAQSAPPVRVYGSVTIDGVDAMPGTLVEATVNGASCGSDRLIGSTYVIDVVSAAKQVWCAVPGATVSFKIGGVPARETAVYEIGSFIKLNLSRARIPLLDPKIERPRMEVVEHDDSLKLKVFPEADAADVTVVSRYARGSALVAIYPATPAGTATLYIIAPTGAAIVSSPDPQDRCASIVGYPNMLVCTVVAGSVVSFQGLGT